MRRRRLALLVGWLEGWDGQPTSSGAGSSLVGRSGHQRAKAERQGAPSPPPPLFDFALSSIQDGNKDNGNKGRKCFQDHQLQSLQRISITISRGSLSCRTIKLPSSETGPPAAADTCNPAATVTASIRYEGEQ